MRRWVRGRTRCGAEQGAATIETVSLTVLAAGLVVAVVLAVTPMGPVLAQRLCVVLASFAGSGSCGGSPLAKLATSRAPARTCTVDSKGREVSGGVSVLFADFGAGGGYEVERLSDDTYVVNVDAELMIGASLTAVEAGLDIEVDDVVIPTEISTEVGVEASASASRAVAGGNGYAFASLAEATAFTDHLERTMKQQLIRSGGSSVQPGPFTWFVPALTSGGIIAYDLATGYDYQPPDATSTFYETTGTFQGSASGGAFVADVGGEASASSTIGFEVDNATQAITVYTSVEYTAELAAKLGLSTSDVRFGTGIDGSGGVELVVAATRDRDGVITAVKFDGVASGSGTVGLTELFGAEPLEGGGAAHLSAQFAVTDANRPQVTQALVGVGALSAVGLTAIGTEVAIPLIVNEARTGGDITAQLYTGGSDTVFDISGGLKVPAIGGVGGNVSYSMSALDLDKAYYLDKGWKVWSACA